MIREAFEGLPSDRTMSCYIFKIDSPGRARVSRKLRLKQEFWLHNQDFPVQVGGSKDRFECITYTIEIDPYKEIT